MFSKYLILLVFVVSAASSMEYGPNSHFGALGVVMPDLCDPNEAVGTHVQMRCSDCLGETCEFPAGDLFSCEEDFQAGSDAAALKLKVEMCFSAEFCIPVMDITLAGSQIEIGHIYSVRYSLYFPENSKGTTVTTKTSIYHEDAEESCVTLEVTLT